MAEKDFPGLGKLSNIPPLGLRPRGGKNSSLPLPGKSIFPAITVIAILQSTSSQDRQWICSRVNYGAQIYIEVITKSRTPFPTLCGFLFHGNITG